MKYMLSNKLAKVQNMLHIKALLLNNTYTHSFSNNMKYIDNIGRCIFEWGENL